MSASQPPRLRRLLGSTLGQMGGRLLLTGLRFLAAIVIVRTAGVAVFGDYSLSLTILLITEVLIDFGLTDTQARALCQDESASGRVLRSAVRARCLGVLTAVALLAVALPFSGLPSTVVAACFYGIPGLLAAGPILAFRTVFRSRLLLERDVGAELASVALVFPVLWFAAAQGAGAPVLIALHAFSRCLCAGIAWLLVRSSWREAWARPGPGNAGDALRQAAPLGLSLLVIAAYDAVDPVLIGRLLGSEAVGWFSGCLRLLMLASLLVQPIASSAFPGLSAAWGKDDAAFARQAREAFRVVAVVSAGLCVLYLSGGGLLLDLMGSEMRSAWPLMGILALLALPRGIMGLVAPLIIVSGAHRHAFALTIGGLALKLALLAWWTPLFGLSGAAWAAVASEAAGLGAAVWLLRRVTGFHLPWAAFLALAPAAALAFALPAALGWRNTVGGVAAAAVLYIAAGRLFGALPSAWFTELLAIIRLRFAGRASVSSA